MANLQQEGGALVVRKASLPDWADEEVKNQAIQAQLRANERVPVADDPNAAEKARIEQEIAKQEKAERAALEAEWEKQQEYERARQKKAEKAAYKKEQAYKNQMSREWENQQDKERAAKLKEDKEYRDSLEAEYDRQQEKEKKAAKEKQQSERAYNIGMAAAWDRQQDAAAKKKAQENRKSTRDYEAAMKRQDAADAKQKKEEERKQAETDRKFEKENEIDMGILRNPKSTTRQRIDARNRIKNRAKKSREAGVSAAKQATGIDRMNKMYRQSYSITPARITNAIEGGLINIGDALVKPVSRKESRVNFKAETKALSGVVRNKNLGKNPFTSVIAPNQAFQKKFVTDGHGRSGQRATLEWRRANRQYVNPQRAAAAQFNENWVNQVAGMPTSPVRHRKVPAGTKNLSPLDRFVGRL